MINSIVTIKVSHKLYLVLKSKPLLQALTKTSHLSIYLLSEANWHREVWKCHLSDSEAFFRIKLKLVFWCFDPINIFFLIKINNFLVDLRNIPARKTSLLSDGLDENSACTMCNTIYVILSVLWSVDQTSQRPAVDTVSKLNQMSVR